VVKDLQNGNRFMRHAECKRVSDGLDPMNVVREVLFNEKISTNAWNTILSPAEASMFQREEV